MPTAPCFFRLNKMHSLCSKKRSLAGANVLFFLYIIIRIDPYHFYMIILCIFRGVCHSPLRLFSVPDCNENIRTVYHISEMILHAVFTKTPADHCLYIALFKNRIISFMERGGKPSCLFFKRDDASQRNIRIFPLQG